MADALEKAPSRSASSTSSEPSDTERQRQAEAVAAWRAAGFSMRARELFAGAKAEEVKTRDFAKRAFPRIPEGAIARLASKLSARGGSAILCGPRGTGKTTLACWLGITTALEHGGTQRYAVWPDVTDEERSRFRAEEHKASPILALRKPDFLVLDEIDSDLRTDFSANQLARLIDHRYGAFLRTVLIVNAAPDELQAVLGAAVLSRMNDTGGILHFDLEPYR